MVITETKVTIAGLAKSYKGDDDGGVFGFDSKLAIRTVFRKD